MAEVVKPLRILLNNDVAWHWEQCQNDAFQKLKLLLTIAVVLRYYSVNEQIPMWVYESNSGLGAGLLQKSHSIAMASKALDNTHAIYTVIEEGIIVYMFWLFSIS